MYIMGMYQCHICFLIEGNYLVYVFLMIFNSLPVYHYTIFLNMDLEFIAKYSIKLNEKSAVSHNGLCKVWSGLTDRDGYGLMNVKLGDKWFLKRVQRLAFVIENNVSFADIEGFDLSHLCHQKLCVAKNHLCLGTREENNYRKGCTNYGRCFGHGDKPDCVFFM